FLGTFPTLEGSGTHEHRGTLGFTLGKAEPPSGATTGGTPERPQKVANIFRNISVSTLSFSYPWKKLARGVSNYGRGRPSRGAAYASGIRHPPHHPTPTLLMNANPLADVRPSCIQEHGNKVKKYRLEHTRPRRATRSNYETKSFIFIECDYKVRLGYKH